MYVKRQVPIRKGAETRRFSGLPPILPYDFTVIFWGGYPAVFWRVLTEAGCCVPKTLELGTTGYQPAMREKP
jgi:hypothetical protein